MRQALKSIPEHPMQPPRNIVSVRINPKNGLLARTNLPQAITEYFRESDVPPADNEIIIANKKNNQLYSSAGGENVPLF